MPSILSQLDLGNTGSCACFNFRRTTRAITKLYDEALQEAGIRSTQFTILVGIAKNQPVPIGAIGNVLILDRTTLTRSLRLLENDGLVAISERSAMRQRFLTLTPKGERTLARSLPAWQRAHDRFLACVGSDYWTDLRRELELLARATLDLEHPKGKVEKSVVVGS